MVPKIKMRRNEIRPTLSERILADPYGKETRELRCFKIDAFVSVMPQNKNFKMTAFKWFFEMQKMPRLFLVAKLAHFCCCVFAIVFTFGHAKTSFK